MSVFYGQHANTNYIDGMKLAADGTATKPGLIPGPARVRVDRSNHPDDGFVERDVELIPGEETTLKIEFGELTSTLEGIVTWRGEPASGALVHLWVDTPWGPEQRESRTRDDGAYWFENLPEGIASLRVDYWRDDTLVAMTMVSNFQLIPENTTRRDVVVFGTAGVTGAVSGLSQGRYANVILISGHHSPAEIERASQLGIYAGFDRLAIWPCDPSGNFTISNLEPGDYTLLAESYHANRFEERETIASAQVTLTADETTTVYLP